MMAVLSAQQVSRDLSGALQRFEIDEPIEVWFGCFNGSEELSRLCRSLSKPSRDGATLMLVVCLPDGSPTLSLNDLLDHGSAADRIVLTSVDGTTVAQWPDTFGDLRAAADQRGLKSVRVEDEAERAVIGSLQGLNAGDTFVVLVPAELEPWCVTGWLTQGARWRESLETQEDDRFHYPPA